MKESGTKPAADIMAEIENGNPCFVLQRLADEEKTAELCLAAARKDGNALDFIPARKRSLKVCLAAAESGSLSLCCVPEKARADKKFWEAACRSGALGLAQVPDEMKTPEMCAKALADWPMNLRFVPDSMKTKAMCADAFARDARTALVVPAAMRTGAMKKAISGMREREEPPVPQDDGHGRYMKVTNVAFMPPGSRFPRYGELDEDIRDMAEAKPKDILVTVWNEFEGKLDWQFQISQHAEGDDLSHDLAWTGGVDYAWNSIEGDGVRVRWRSVADIDWYKDGGEEESRETGVEVNLDGAWMPLKAGDLKAAGWEIPNGDAKDVLCNAMRFAGQGIGQGVAEALASLAAEGEDDAESAFEGWFMDAIGRDKWLAAERYPDWVAEDDCGGLAGVFRRADAEGDGKQIFADKLKWGAIAIAVYYADCGEDGSSCNADQYDDWSYWKAVGACRS
ncbi:MAG: hypothetical protein J5828_06035 [Desulfovibrionaceae bacterium]|nr:hypothetical protein [Desulfovibrionaceae bacterium]